jgi:hypothetical protein
MAAQSVSFSSLTPSLQYESVERLTPSSHHELLHEALLWKDTIERIQTYVVDQKMEQLILDYHYVVSDIVAKLQGGLSDKIHFLLAKDSTRKIQGIARYEFRHQFEDRKSTLFVKNLLSAPWNIRWPKAVFFEQRPLHGAGVLLVHALFALAKQKKIEALALHSAPSSEGFYRKIGMKNRMYNLYEFLIERKSQESQLNKVFLKTLKYQIHYSLLV